MVILNWLYREAVCVVHVVLFSLHVFKMKTIWIQEPLISLELLQKVFPSISQKTAGKHPQQQHAALNVIHLQQNRTLPQSLRSHPCAHTHTYRVRTVMEKRSQTANEKICPSGPFSNNPVQLLTYYESQPLHLWRIRLQKVKLNRWKKWLITFN